MRAPAPSLGLRPPSQPHVNLLHNSKCLAARWPRSHLCRAALCGARLDPATEALLDSFWLSRGVFDKEKRNKLVQTARKVDRSEGWAPGMGGSLPGIAATWQLGGEEMDSAAVLQVSARLMQLRDLLGARDDVDLVRMLVREPGLLAASMADLTSRMLDIKLAEGQGMALDVAKLVEAQPALLLQPPVALDDQETAAERLQAWQHGLLSDGAPEQNRQLAALAAYSQQHGDAHVGHRQGDDAELVRWAAKQRAAWKRAELPESRMQQLDRLGFYFDEEAAEWRRWFNELAAFQRRTGHCSPEPLADGDTFLLINWCSVQRIARRSRYLTAARIQLLDDIDFDWTGADALS